MSNFTPELASPKSTEGGSRYLTNLETTMMVDRTSRHRYAGTRSWIPAFSTKRPVF